MSIPNSTQEAGTTTISQGLREVADWLEAHPEIEVWHSFVKVRAIEREDLEALAAALGDRAEEHETYGPAVEIRGEFGGGTEFGGTQVYGSVKLSKLVDEPVQPAYSPILPPKPDENFDRLTGEGRR